MQIQIYENNQVILTGRIVRIKSYTAKAANVVVAIDSGTDKDGNPKSQFISLKSFKPDEWANWKEGMLVRCYGHMSSNVYEQDGEKVYSQDTILDNVIYLESKEVVNNREAIKASK